MKSTDRISRILIIASVLFFLDTFVLNQGAIALFTAFILIIWMVPKLLYLLIRRRDVRFHLLKMLIFLLMAAGIFGLNYAQNQLAYSRAEKIIGAVEQYQRENGSYPGTLEELVPEYIKLVPRTKYTLIYNKFSYSCHADSPSLVFATFPPFGRQIYKFKTKEWGMLD